MRKFLIALTLTTIAALASITGARLHRFNSLQFRT